MSIINIRRFHCSVCKRPALVQHDKNEIQLACSECKKETKYVFEVPTATVVHPSSAARPTTNVVPKPSTTK